MKTLRLLVGLAMALMVAGEARAVTNLTATVILPLRTDSGLASTNRAITAVPVYVPLSDLTNFFWGAPLVYYSTNTVAGWATNCAVMNLVPNSYSLSVAGVPGTATITVTTNMLGTTNWAGALSGNLQTVGTVNLVLMAQTNVYQLTNSYVTTNLYWMTNVAMVTVTNMPFVSVFNDGTYIVGGVSNKSATSTTYGIQEAIAAIAQADGTGKRSSGGVLLIGPGLFKPSTCITNPWGTNNYSLTIRGSGPQATYLAGMAGQSVLKIGTLMTTDIIDLHLYDLTLCSAVNSCTNLLYLNGLAGPYGSSVSRATIQNCCFRYGTNMMWLGGAESLTKRNLIGIQANNNFCGKVVINNCFFYSVQTAIDCGFGWGDIKDNDIEFCGRYGGLTTDWTAASPFYIGAGIVFREAGTTYNVPKQIVVDGNFFVNTAPGYANCLPMDGPTALSQTIVIQNSATEIGDSSPLAVTGGRPLVFVNEREGARTMANPTFHPRYLMPSLSDFTSWNTVAAPTNLVSFVDWEQNAFNGPLTAPNYLTATNAGAVTVNLNQGYADFSTNAAFAFGGFNNVSPTAYQSCVMLVSNSTGSAFAISTPANCHVVGTANVTNMTVCSFFCNAGRWTNLVVMPLW